MNVSRLFRASLWICLWFILPSFRHRKAIDLSHLRAVLGSAMGERVKCRLKDFYFTSIFGQKMIIETIKSNDALFSQLFPTQTAIDGSAAR